MYKWLSKKARCSGLVTSVAEFDPTLDLSEAKRTVGVLKKCPYFSVVQGSKCT